MYNLTHTSSIIRTSDGATIPAEAENTDYQAYLAWKDAGGVAEYQPPALPPQTPEQQQAALTAAVQSHLDATARAKGYDSLLSAVSYVGSPVFGSEAVVFRDWRDAVWGRCYEVEAAVQAGARPLPTVAEVIGELPGLVLP